MKQLFSKIFWFILPVPFLWVLLTFLYGSLVPTIYQKNVRYASAGGFAPARFSEADTASGVELLVLGSSHAYRGFDPRIFDKEGIEMFNLGSSAQRMIQTRYLVEKYLEKLQPEMVIVEVSSMNFTGDGLESALDICYSMGDPDLDMLEMVFEVNQVKSYNTFLYATLRHLMGEGPQEKRSENGEKYIPGGYVESYKVIDDPESLHERLPAEEVDFAGNRHVRAFEDILGLLREKNIPVILVQAPTSVAYNSSISNKAEIDRYLSSFPGIPYYNFNELISLDDDCFLDLHHMNQKGVTAFNKALVQKLPDLRMIAQRK